MELAKRIAAHRAATVLAAALLVVGGGGAAAAGTLLAPGDGGDPTIGAEEPAPEEGGGTAPSTGDGASGAGSYSAGDCTAALELPEGGDPATIFEEGGSTGLAHAMEVVWGNCQEHPNPGLVNALGRLSDNWQRHADHEAWKAERAAEREAARAERAAEREAAKAEREAARAERAAERQERLAARHADGHPGGGRGHS